MSNTYVAQTDKFLVMEIAMCMKTKFFFGFSLLILSFMSTFPAVVWAIAIDRAVKDDHFILPLLPILVPVGLLISAMSLLAFRGLRPLKL